MMELIQKYYAVERHTALIATATGVLLALIALALWRTSGPVSLNRGIAQVFLVAGLMLGGAGFGYSFVIGDRAQKATTAYSAYTERDIRQKETTRIEGVLKSSYRGPLITYTALILGGLALLLFSMDESTRKGTALALMIVGVLGHCLEAYSMQANRQYLLTVNSLHVS